MFDIFCYFSLPLSSSSSSSSSFDAEFTFAFYLLGFMCIPEPPKRVKLAMDVAKKSEGTTKRKKKQQHSWACFCMISLYMGTLREMQA